MKEETSEDFYFTDEEGWFVQVEEQVYCVPMEAFARRSATFEKFLVVRLFHDALAGTCEEHSIRLDQLDPSGQDVVAGSSEYPCITKREFESLLTYMVGKHWSDPSLYSLQDLEDILRLGTLWCIPEARWFAVRELEHTNGFENAKRLSLACKYNVSDWIKPSFISLAKHHILASEDIAVLGTALSTLIIQCQKERSQFRASLVTANPPAQCDTSHERCSDIWPQLWQVIALKLLVFKQCIYWEDDLLSFVDAVYKEQQHRFPLCSDCYGGIKDDLHYNGGILLQEASIIDTMLCCVHEHFGFPEADGDKADEEDEEGLIPKDW
ncbi:hypothetical protein EIP91_010525 [Steccherinum ochraceum]|uniref:BTB domain-containing protein n=1 Tax=Steccherinum ochraceum TaxID=92696 RepID=A0A4R0R9E4_9APHY|nr:hypothetical protein EIP91_010525 [Steccherinum ochraceum]